MRPAPLRPISSSCGNQWPHSAAPSWHGPKRGGWSARGRQGYYATWAEKSSEKKAGWRRPWWSGSARSSPVREQERERGGCRRCRDGQEEGSGRILRTKWSLAPGPGRQTWQPNHPPTCPSPYTPRSIGHTHAAASAASATSAWSALRYPHRRSALLNDAHSTRFLHTLHSLRASNTTSSSSSSSTESKSAPSQAPLSPAEAAAAAGSTTAHQEQKPYYVTTPIFYVNAAPHIGHLHSMVLADVCARWAAYKRGDDSAGGVPSVAPLPPAAAAGAVEQAAHNDVARAGAGSDKRDEVTDAHDHAHAHVDVGAGVRVLLATGTDEHGQKVQRAAAQDGNTPQAMCDRVSETFRVLTQSLAAAAGLMRHTFIRTTDAEHVKAVQHLWRRLNAAGHIYKGSHQGWYAISDEAFYTDSQIRKVKSASGEEHHESIETGQRVEWHSESNYKFRLSSFRERLIRWIEEDPESILPSSRREQVLEELRRTELEDLSVSRPRNRLEWGIQVPDDEEHTIYVWIDALTNYLTVAGYPWEDGSPPQASAWPADAHILGKDIIRFHAIYWPAMLLAASLPLPRKIVTHGHWTSSNKKMSKSLGNVQDPFESLSLLGRDETRWFLLRIGGRLDGDCDWAPGKPQEYIRKFLAGQIGNLALRLRSPKLLSDAMQPRHSGHDANANGVATDSRSSLILRRDGADGTSEGVPLPQAAQEMLSKLAALPNVVDEAMKQYETSRALTAISDVMGEANALIANLAPWSKGYTPAERRMILYALHESVRVSSCLLKPFMPDKMQKLQHMFGFAQQGLVGWHTLACAPKEIGVVFDAPRVGEEGDKGKGKEKGKRKGGAREDALFVSHHQ